MEQFYSILERKFHELNSSEKKIINEVWDHRTIFIQWPARAMLLWEGCVRKREHYRYPDDVRKELKSKGTPTDTRMGNGPAITSFLHAGGIRPKRTSNPNKEWNIHHICDGNFPWPEKGETIHAAKDGKHFTQSVGLVAIHPVAEALADEYFCVAWVLRHESFLRFNYDPDLVFCRKIDEFGFKTT